MIFVCKSVSTPMEGNVDLWFNNSHTLDDPRRYRRLIVKLFYLTVSRPNITFAEGVLSRFIHQPKEAHCSAALRIFASKVVPKKAWCTENIDMYTFLNTLTQAMLVTEERENLPLNIVPLLDETCDLEE